MNLERKFRKFEGLLEARNEMPKVSDGTFNLLAMQFRLYAEIELTGRELEEELADRAADGEDICRYVERYAKLLENSELLLNARILCIAKKRNSSAVAG